MIHLSQNKKIAFSAFGLFLVSFVMMALFLRNSGELGKNGEANILEAHEAGAETETAIDDTEKIDFIKIVGKTLDPVIVINAEGKVEYANAKFCDMISVKCAKFNDILFFDFINAKDLSGFVSTYGKLFQTGQKIDGMGPYRLLKGKGEIIVLLDAKPLLEDEKVFAVALHVKDITEKVNELNKGKEVAPENSPENSPKNTDSNWIENIYPNFKEIKDQLELKFMVNKLS
ncbi:MAG: PAS domain-containing protein [Candidatus Peregrinibacteria bacterium]|nr:PAS domain-containing protein [Candidatus Peregrinibacteria bacterium]